MKLKKLTVGEVRAVMLAMSRSADSDRWLILRNKAGVGSPNFREGPNRTAYSGNWVGKPTQPYNVLAHFVTDECTLYVGRPRPKGAIEVVDHTRFGVPRHRFHMVDVQKFVLDPGALDGSLFRALVSGEVSPNSVTYTYWPHAADAAAHPNAALPKPHSRPVDAKASHLLEAALREGLSEADALDIEHKAYRRSPLHQRLKRGLLKVRGSVCAVTGAQPQDMLIASHTKPWARCTESERRDPANVLLLLPPIDYLFDRGYISFKANGAMDVSKISAAQLRHFGLVPQYRALNAKVSARMRDYLQEHRAFWGFE